MKKLFVFLLLCIFIPLVQADLISINSGGSENIIVNPGANIDGFFLGSVCGDGVCNSDETCLTCPADCGVCTTPDDGTGGGGGSGGGTTTPEIVVEPMEINIKLAVNTNREYEIEVENLEDYRITVDVSEENLGNMVILDKESLVIDGSDTKTLKVIFVALDKTGIYTGKIKIGNEEVLVSINIKTKLLLFDSNIVVLNKNYRVEQGKDLKTQVTLIPMGDDERLDVTLNYVIKDYDENIYLTKSETLLVEEQIDFKREFNTGLLPFGDYIVGLELIYPGGVAPSSAHFEVVGDVPRDFLSNIVFYLINLILLILILIIIILISRKIKERRRERLIKW